MLPLADPETCRTCHVRARVVESRRLKRGYRLRRHVCPKCRAEWRTYQTRMDPRKITARPPDR